MQVFSQYKTTFTTLILTAFVSTAHAQMGDMNSKETSMGDKKNFINLFIGHDYPRPLKFKVRKAEAKEDNFRPKNMIGLGIGRVFFKNFAAEFNVQEFQKHKADISGTFKHRAKLHTTTFNLNGYYYHNIGQFTPYATFGLGMARNKLYDLKSKNSWRFAQLPSGTKNRLAWSGI